MERIARIRVTINDDYRQSLLDDDYKDNEIMDQVILDLTVRPPTHGATRLSEHEFIEWEDTTIAIPKFRFRPGQDVSTGILNLMEAIRNNFDSSEEARDEAKEQIDKWYASFYGECPGCHRENQYCRCP